MKCVFQFEVEPLLDPTRSACIVLARLSGGRLTLFSADDDELALPW